jgi:hypothetical protein
MKVINTSTGLKILHYTNLFGKRVMRIESEKLKDEPIYLDVTVDTALRNQLKDQLIKLAL